LKFDIKQATHLAICGHDPHSEILELLPPKFTLVTNDNTVYPKNEKDAEENEENYPTVCRELIFQKINQRRISEVKYLHKEGITSFKDYSEFLEKKN
jgi:hypothetical protein